MFSVVTSAARLPFKRLNTEPKEIQPPKRLCEHACPEPGVSDRENESSLLPLHNGPPLVNGRGPLDGFLSRRRPEPSNENVIVDLTADDPLSPAKRLVSPAPASSRLRPKANQGKSETTTSVKSNNVDCTSNLQTSEETTIAKKIEEREEEDGGHIASISDVDLTKNSESEPEEQDESGNVSSLGNKSTLSNSSVTSSSECSPEKSEGPTESTTPNTVRLAHKVVVRVSYVRE